MAPQDERRATFRFDLTSAVCARRLLPDRGQRPIVPLTNAKGCREIAALYPASRFSSAADWSALRVWARLSPDMSTSVREGPIYRRRWDYITRTIR